MRKQLSLIEMYRALRVGVKPRRYPPSGAGSLFRAGGGALLSRWPAVRAATLFLVLIGTVALSVPAQENASAPAGGACPPLGAASGTVACRFDAALTRLFTPRDVPPGTYRVFVTRTMIAPVAAAFAGRSPAQHVPGAWTVQEMDPLGAFGEAGPYDRAKVARLYVGLRARVAHGPIVEGGRTVAAITLISPYPDPTLSRLDPGTLIVQFAVVRPTTQAGT